MAEVRKPYVAGRFYPAKKAEIEDLLNKILEKEKPGIDVSLSALKIIGGVIPHAGYVYSAYQAIHFFEILKLSLQTFDSILIINPNHTGYGEDMSVDVNESWETPIGKVELDTEFVQELDLPRSAIAHKYEHSGEVILPYLQSFTDFAFRIVPVCMKIQTPEKALDLANRIYLAARNLKRKILVLASSDFSHQVDPEFGRIQDERVVHHILEKDITGIYSEVRHHKISVCGYGPIMTLVAYSQLLSHNSEFKVLKKGNSGEVYPSDSVVDYISILAYLTE